jgi:fructokinase
MNAITNQIVGTGLIALDVLLRDKNFALYSALGGSTGNVLAILAHLGWDSLPVAHIGSDNAGTCIRKEFESLGSDTRFLIDQDIAKTPVIYQWPGDEEKTHRFSFACPLCGSKKRFSDYACSHDFVNAVSETFSAPQVFYFDRITPLALELAQIYRDNGGIIFFEPSEIQDNDEGMRKALALTHILKYADDRISDLVNFNLSNITVEIQTLGAQGLRFRAPSLTTEWIELSAIKVPYMADTAGAGDWCSAGLLYRLFSNDNATTSGIFSHNNLCAALRFGQALSALNCMYEGARGIMHHRSSSYITRAARALSKRSPFDFSVSGVKSEQVRMQHYYKAVISQKYQQNKPIQDTNLCCEPLQFITASHF